MAKTEFRFGGLSFTDSGAALLSGKRSHAPLDAHVDHRQAGATPRKLWDRSQEDAYSNPGTPQRRERASGTSTLLQDGNSIYLTGTGASPEGATPVHRSPRSDDAQDGTRLFQTTGRTLRDGDRRADRRRHARF